MEDRYRPLPGDGRIQTRRCGNETTLKDDRGCGPDPPAWDGTSDKLS